MPDRLTFPAAGWGLADGPAAGGRGGLAAEAADRRLAAGNNVCGTGAAGWLAAGALYRRRIVVGSSR